MITDKDRERAIEIEEYVLASERWTREIIAKMLSQYREEDTTRPEATLVQNRDVTP